MSDVVRVYGGAMLMGLLTVLPAPNAGAQGDIRVLPAFPGAEGFGRHTVGGRGGDVYLVTTLADYGSDEAPVEGSLRAAVQSDGPRTIVFRVPGYIELERPLEIHHPYVTIAAQTAPGDGITLKNFGVEVYAPEVILRYLRVRPGDVAGIEQDAINIRAPNVIVDHCSVSWATDETLSIIDDATNVTVQWCLITESLNNSVHSKGLHGYGTLLTATGNVTIHHNAYAFHYSRSPRPKDLTLDFRNNLIYGFGDQAGYNHEDTTRLNYVGNYVFPLPYSRNPGCAFSLGGTNSRFFVENNALHGAKQKGSDPWRIICTSGDLTREEAEAHVRLRAPIVAAPVDTQSPDVAFERILAEAGAMLPARDAVDRRLIDTIREGRGNLIDSQSDVGGWPSLRSALAPTDSDRDGMPDEWEVLHGLDPLDGSDHAGDRDGDGYTNLEEYLNGTDPNQPDL